MGRSCVTSKHRVQKDTQAGPQGPGGRAAPVSLLDYTQWEFTAAGAWPVKLANRTSKACWDTKGTRCPGRGNHLCHSRRSGPTDTQVGLLRCGSPVRHSYKQVDKHGFEFRAQGNVGRTSQACRET